MNETTGSLCVCHNLRMAARLITRRYERAFAQHNLTAGQFTILTAVSEHPNVRIGQLADAIGLERTSLTRELKLLESRGLVISVAHKKDARIRQLQLTEAGSLLCKAARNQWEKAQAKTFEMIDPEEWKLLQKCLKKLTRNFDEENKDA